MAVVDFGSDGMNTAAVDVTVPGEGGVYFFINETEHTISGVFGAGGDLSFTRQGNNGPVQIGNTDRYSFTMEGRSVMQFTVANASDDPRTFGFNTTTDRIGGTHGTPLGGRSSRSSTHGLQRFYTAQGT